jgi:bla regulator protein BlaR1
MIDALGNHLWQSTVFAATAGLLTLTLRRNRACVRYWLWLAASVKFLVPFGFLVAIGSQFGWPSASIALEPRVAVAIESIGRPFSQSAPQLSRAAVVATRDAGAAVPGLLVMLAAVAAVWFVGCGALAVVWAVRWTRVAVAVRRGSRLESGRELRLLRRLEQIGGVRRPIDVVSSDAPLEPGVFGILKPVLLWPRRITAHLADEQVEAILAHELCHVRRRDNLAAAVHALVQALFWFHPLVWWVGARLVVERERACDEEVVRLGSDPRVYAESILKTCQLSVESPRVCVAGVSGSDLKKRIEQILESDDAAPLNAWRKLVLGTAGVAAIAVPLAIGVVSGPRLRAQAPKVQDTHGGLGPPDLNRLVGFELLPGAPHLPTDDPHGAVAWNVAIDHPSGRLSFVGFTGRGLIRYAYGLRDLPVVSGPSWIDTESFELSASTSAEATDDEVRLVLQKLLEDRVKLAGHHETRDFPVYALVAARSDGVLGPGLHPSTSACLDAAAMRRAALRGETLRQRAGSFCGVERGISGMTFERVTMTELAEELSRSGSIIDRKVVDRTGLTGAFDASLGLGFLPAAIVLTRYPATGVLLEPLGVRSIFNALPEQLGLKLNDATMPGDVLVIDRAERPE